MRWQTLRYREYGPRSQASSRLRLGLARAVPGIAVCQPLKPSRFAFCPVREILPVTPRPNEGRQGIVDTGLPAWPSGTEMVEHGPVQPQRTSSFVPLSLGRPTRRMNLSPCPSRSSPRRWWSIEPHRFAAPKTGLKSDAAPRLLDTNLPSPQDGFS